MIKNNKNRHLKKDKQKKKTQDLTFEEINKIAMQMSEGMGLQFFGITPYGFWY